MSAVKAASKIAAAGRFLMVHASSASMTAATLGAHETRWAYDSRNFTAAI